MLCVQILNTIEIETIAGRDSKTLAVDSITSGDGGGDISPFPEQLDTVDTNDTRYLTLSRHYSKLLTNDFFLFSQPNMEDIYTKEKC